MRYVDSHILQQCLIKRWLNVASKWTTIFNHSYYKNICTENARKDELILPVIICSSTRLTNLRSLCADSCKEAIKD